MLERLKIILIEFLCIVISILYGFLTLLIMIICLPILLIVMLIYHIIGDNRYTYY